jgi:hypothetical protein
MSIFGISIKYDDRIFTRETSGIIEWGNYKAKINEIGITLFVNFELSKKEKALLFKVIAKNMNKQEEQYKINLPVYYPHWNLIPPELQKKIFELNEQLHTGARQLDQFLRKNNKALRLPIYRFNEIPPNQSPKWNVGFWNLKDENLELFKNTIVSLGSLTTKRVAQSIPIPFPDSLKGRHVQLDENDIKFFQKLASETEPEQVPPFSSLFGYAIQNFENRSFSAFIISLTATLETGLKWYLGNNGDRITNYLLDNIQSPPLPNLLSVAITECGLPVPTDYKKWLEELIKIRNSIVHKPKTINYKILEMTRWLAIGESIILAIQGITPYSNSGYLITISKHSKSLPPNTKAIILREEEDYGETNLHIILDSGVSARTKEGSFEIDTDQKIK